MAGRKGGETAIGTWSEAAQRFAFDLVKWGCVDDRVAADIESTPTCSRKGPPRLTAVPTYDE
jgi:hypothetical protein